MIWVAIACGGAIAYLVGWTVGFESGRLKGIEDAHNDKESD